MMFGKRILILAAHPDDEVVACAASIARARARGATVSVLFLTNGCIAQSALWPWQRKRYDKFVAARRAEGEKAAILLGVLPVGWAERPARSLWKELPVVFREVSETIDRYRPDQLWVPAYEGGNPDHDALNAIGFKCKQRMSVLEFAEYNFFGGEARSNQFVSSDETVRLAELTAEEQADKKKALAVYASEKGNLSYVKTAQESYRPLSLYDYARPPHQGTLWYERFQWVPFKHPRIDFTRSYEVSVAIKDFLR